jgi:RNA polymerase sigma-70 factor (ECF subfamily)
MSAVLAETNGPEQGLGVLDAIAQDVLSAYQTYWAVRAHLLQRLGRTTEASEAYDPAIGLAEGPAIQRVPAQTATNGIV